VPKIARSALVMHSADAMFDIVQDIANYPEFLPWCSSSEVLEQTEHKIVAKLGVSKGPIAKEFVTCNTSEIGRSVHMNLVKGPFEYLEGHWLFETLNDTACKVSLKLDYEVSPGLFGIALDSIFSDAANKMVDAFCQRADQLNGR